MYWLREIAGWLLLILGLWLFYSSYFVWLKAGLNFQGGVVFIMGVMVFRGGIHLLKVAVAARVCQTAPIETQPRSVTAHRPNTRTTVVPGRR